MKATRRKFFGVTAGAAAAAPSRGTAVAQGVGSAPGALMAGGSPYHDIQHGVGYSIGSLQTDPRDVVEMIRKNLTSLSLDDEPDPYEMRHQRPHLAAAALRSVSPAMRNEIAMRGVRRARYEERRAAGEAELKRWLAKL